MTWPSQPLQVEKSRHLPTNLKAPQNARIFLLWTQEKDGKRIWSCRHTSLSPLRNSRIYQALTLDSNIGFQDSWRTSKDDRFPLASNPLTTEVGHSEAWNLTRKLKLNFPKSLGISWGNEKGRVHTLNPAHCARDFFHHATSKARLRK